MKRFYLTLSLLLVSTSFLFSQKLVVTKDDGSVIVGTMLSETDSDLVVRTKNDAGIGIDLTISKADIKEQRAWGPNDRDFEPIEDLLPTPDLLPEKSYREQIAGCERYLETHKETATAKQRAAVEESLKTLKSELAMVQEGGLKFDGRWIKKADRETNEYEIDMRIAIAEMKSALAEGNHRKAMQVFDVIEADFANSERFEEARALALEVLTDYKRMVGALLKNVDQKIAARTQSLAGLAPAERAAEEAAIKRLDDRYQALLKADQESKTQWLYLDEYHKAPMEMVMRSITQVESTLSRPPSDNAKVVGPIYRELWGAIRSEDFETAKKLQSELKSLKVPDRYLNKIEAQINPPAPEPDPATIPDPAPDPDPSTENPDPAPTPKADEPVKKPETGDTAADPKEPAEEAKTDEKKGFPTQLVLVVVLVLVIAGALVAALGGKKK